MDNVNFKYDHKPSVQVTYGVEDGAPFDPNGCVQIDVPAISGRFRFPMAPDLGLLYYSKHVANLAREIATKISSMVEREILSSLLPDDKLQMGDFESAVRAELRLEGFEVVNMCSTHFAVWQADYEICRVNLTEAKCEISTTTDPHRGAIPGFGESVWAIKFDLCNPSFNPSSIIDKIKSLRHKVY